MKSKDQILLEKAYTEILAKNSQSVEEKINWKGAVAGAALGLGSLASSSASDKPMTFDDQADKEMISYANAPETPKHLESTQAAFDHAVSLVHAGHPIDKSTLELIITNKDLAERLAHLLTLKEQPLPKLLKTVVGDYDVKLKSSLVGP